MTAEETKGKEGQKREEREKEVPYSKTPAGRSLFLDPARHANFRVPEFSSQTPYGVSGRCPRGPQSASAHRGSIANYPYRDVFAHPRE